jgi:hypothetical protein
MLSFLWSFYKKHKGTLTTLTVLAITLIGTIWSYDIKQLTQTGELTHQETLRIRSFLTLITTSLYFLSLLITTLYHYKKDTEPDIAQRLVAAQKKSAELLKPKHIEEPQISILKLLFSHEQLTTEEVAASLHLQLQAAQYHLVELKNVGMVDSGRFSQQRPGAGPFDLPSLIKYSAWIIMQPGRKYLLDNKLVS